MYAQEDGKRLTVEQRAVKRKIYIENDMILFYNFMRKKSASLISNDMRKGKEIRKK